jgi:hypothetical protein
MPTTAQSLAQNTIAHAGEDADGLDIRSVLSRRSDLSTFVVHLSRDNNGGSAADRLRAIIAAWKIEAKSPFRAAVRSGRDDIDSQRCVCFTETPLEYLHLLVGRIEGRQYDFGPYGVAITKQLARKKGANPVWYVDITPGHDWLMNPINELIDKVDGAFDESPVSRIAPFIEQMGTGNGRKGDPYRKEFWWEREWRHVGDFSLPERVLLICPEDDFTEFEGMARANGHSAACVDPRWGLEQIIARLAGFSKEDVEIP